MAKDPEDHDQRAKVAVSEFPEWFFNLITPDWAAGLDCAKVEWQQQEVFTDPPDGPRRLLDLVGKLSRLAATQGQSLWVIAHLEIESADRATNLRKQLAENWRPLKARHNLPVRPLALLLDVALEGRGVDVYREIEDGQEVNAFSIQYLGLPGLQAQDYIESDNLLAVAFTVRMHAPDTERPRLKARALQRIGQSTLPDHKKVRLAEFVEAYGPLEGGSLEAFNKLLQTQEYKEADMVAKTSFDLGLEQGAERCLRETLFFQLETRFGPLSAAVEERFAALTQVQLRELRRKIVAPDATLATLGLEE